MISPDYFFGGPSIPSEAECGAEARRRGMSVTLWEPATPDRCWWRVVFMRKDGTALLLWETWSDSPEADVFPTATLASAEMAPIETSVGYGSIPYGRERGWLGTLLDAFRDWDGGDALACLSARLLTLTPSSEVT